MTEDHLNALLLLFIHKDIALDYDAIIDDDAKRKRLRSRRNCYGPLLAS